MTRPRMQRPHQHRSYSEPALLCRTTAHTCACWMQFGVRFAPRRHVSVRSSWGLGLHYASVCRSGCVSHTGYIAPNMYIQKKTERLLVYLVFVFFYTSCVIFFFKEYKHTKTSDINLFGSHSSCSINLYAGVRWSTKSSHP